jgi:hypothetical protein
MSDRSELISGTPPAPQLDDALSSAHEHPEDDHALSCAAAGLWYRIRAAERIGPVTKFELMTLVGDPTAWHPEGELEDFEFPLNELMANGWVLEEDGRYSTSNCLT